MSIFLPILATSTNVNIIVPIELSLWIKICQLSIIDLGIKGLPIGLAVALPRGHVHSQVEAGQDHPAGKVADRSWVVVIYPLQGNTLVLN